MASVGSNSGTNTWTGCLCLLGAYLVGSLYNILIRRLSSQFSSFELTYVMFAVGFLFFAVLTFVQYGRNTAGMLSAAVVNRNFIISCLYLGGASSVVAYMLANYSLSRLPVTRVSIFNCFATVVSVLSGVILMGDPFTMVSAAAVVMILTGVTGVNYFANRLQ